MSGAPLYEVFSSIQGEASHVGERHLFVRLAGCDLECVYCDTPASRRVPLHARIFFPDGVREEANPLAPETLDRIVRELDDAAGPHHAIAITGGEPLLFWEYLRPLCERWRARGWKILLETGGHRPVELAQLIDCVDYVMADIKVASSAGVTTDPETVRAFLAAAAQRECAAKVVCAAKTTLAEIEAVAGLAAGAGVPLILQPVSGQRFGPPTGEVMLALQRAAMTVCRDTRVIPQTHRQLHLR